VTVAVEKPPNGQIAFRLGLGEKTCRLALLWAADPNAAPNISRLPTAPIEACFTRNDVDEAAFNLWRNHGRGSDPTLIVPLVGDPQKPGSMISSDALRGRLFVRDCHSAAPRYRRYADITINAGALELTVRPNQVGALDLRLLGRGVALDQIDDKTWKDVVRKCEDASGRLPDTPAAGRSAFLIGGNVGLAPRGDPIHQALGDLRLHIEDLHAREVLKWPEAMRLVSPIDDADARRRQGRSDDALQAVDQLADEIQSLGRSGALPAEETKALLGDAQSIRADISEILIGTVGVRRKCPAKECAPITLHADSRVVPGANQDGSAARPFSSIAAALDAAEARGVCGVRVVVAPGTYTGDLVISRNTSIFGAVERRRPQVVIRGSLESDGAHDLNIYGVSFLESPRAAIRVSNPCAYTILQAVWIESASHFGIDIDGGALAANDVLVTSTRGTITVIASGVGIRLQGGVQAAMSAVELTDNDDGALTVMGEGTRAYARHFIVRRNRILGGLFSVIAAVSALDRALLLMEESVIEDNESIGLLGAGRSLIHFRAGQVTGTRRAELPGRGGEAGFNALSYTNSILELHTFTLADGALGVQYASGGTGISTDGDVFGNGIGVSIQGSMFPLACITRDVYVFGNERDFDGDALPLPDVEPPDLKVATPLTAPEMSEPVCSIAPVAFVCDWCTTAD
jgi:nitrous oxidase accessory protein NosD